MNYKWTGRNTIFVTGNNLKHFKNNEVYDLTSDDVQTLQDQITRGYLVLVDDESEPEIDPDEEVVNA